ncbi:Signal recognition particle protein [Candidatus Cyrtobacter comes]|uniref:signal-recognition-particle GTPase n=2 Tax=Candidatus Cyrtobacter comes TaxID=675776 RepID=A0ABU5L8D1_9RICK|nr:Signal recognition particle protein [Candidatus Cyrtobacter comes]
MFNSISSGISSIFNKFLSRGLLTDREIEQFLSDIRIILLESDVSLSATKALVSSLEEKIGSSNIKKSISPGKVLMGLFQEELHKLIGAFSTLKISEKNTVIMLVGLQGSGKTTTAAKLASLIKKKNQNKNIKMVSLDTTRPAAMEQLAKLGNDNAIEVLSYKNYKSPIDIAKAIELAPNDILIVDTAGRMQVDESLMHELNLIKGILKPCETILVSDIMIGQEALNIASSFNFEVGLSGIIFTKMDSDAKGGAAISMTYDTKLPIKFLCSGEANMDIYEFHPDRIALRIMGSGDVESLRESIEGITNEQESEVLVKRIKEGKFDFTDMLSQLQGMKKMGGVASILGMLSGNVAAKINTKELKNKLLRQEAMIRSMTKKERMYPAIINGSRKKRIALGSGVSIVEINRLIKQFLSMQSMFKKFGKLPNSQILKMIKSGGLI